MYDPSLEICALWLADHTPILRDPVSPPIRWVLEGDILRVLMADGRTFRKPLDEIKAALQAEHQAKKLHPAVHEDIDVVKEFDDRPLPDVPLPEPVKKRKPNSA